MSMMAKLAGARALARAAQARWGAQNLSLRAGAKTSAYESRRPRRRTKARATKPLTAVTNSTNVNELEDVPDPLTRLAPLATLSSKAARAGIQVGAPLAPLGERAPEVRARVRGCAEP